MSVDSIDSSSNADITNICDNITINNNISININYEPKVILAMLELNQQLQKVKHSALKALPPWAEELRIENAIRGDEAIKEALGTDVISIRRDLEALEANVYIVTGEDGKEIKVMLHYGQTDLIGPSPISFEILNDQ